MIRKRSLAAIRALLRGMDASPFDLLELRLDACEDLAPEGLASIPLPLPAIFTLRRKEEGGAWPHGEEDRLRLLRALMRLKPAYLDVESSVPPDRIAMIRAESPETGIILSRHDFRRTPDSLEDMLDPMRAVAREVAREAACESAGNVIYKIAARAESTLDALRMLVFCKERSERGVPLVGISMGDLGASTRILAPVVHTGFCYCPVEEASAPGQLEAAVLRAAYNFSRLNRRTAMYGLLGDPVEHSIGHLYHNARNAAEGRDAVYVKWRITREEIGRALPLFTALGVRGLSLTMPLKECVLPYLSGMDETVRAVGAANTLRAADGGWDATNTDGAGALKALARHMRDTGVRGKKIVILGAGGAARAVMHQAVRLGATVRVYNRTTDKRLPADLAALPYNALADTLVKTAEPCDAIINALPFDIAFPFERLPFCPGATAMDLAYGNESAFLRQAAAAGCAAVDGSGMFVEQAKLQRAFWGPQMIAATKKALSLKKG